jgi:hypothetical protein
MKFCLLTLTQREHPEPARFAFFLERPEELRDETRRFVLMPEDFRLLNPNTGTCPVFRSADEAELARAIYRRVPVLVREGDPDGNPWGVEFLLMFMMNTDSRLFRTREQLARAGFALRGNVFARGEERYLPLYEAKLLHQFDHRWASYGGPGRWEGEPEAGGPYLERPPRQPDEAVALTLAAKQDPALVVLPRYWVPEAEVEARLARKGWSRPWLLGWRDITNATNERTVIASLIPRVGVGHTFVLLLPSIEDGQLILGLVANLDALVLDFITRLKAGGTHLTFHITKQLPVLPPSVYQRPCAWSPGETLAGWLRPRVLELVYTAWDLAPAARDLGDSGPPFRWEPERRAQLRAELDAAFFLLYGLTRSQVEFVLGTFPVLRANEEKAFGEFRTARLVLTAYDALVAAQTLGEPYRSPLDPPPGDDDRVSGTRLRGAALVSGPAAAPQPPGPGIPIGCGQSSQGGHEHHTAVVRHGACQVGAFRRVMQQSEPLHEPLDCCTGRIDAPIERIARAGPQEPSNRRQKPVLGAPWHMPDLHQDECARPVGGLRHTWFQAGMTQEGRLLIHGKADERYRQAGKWGHQADDFVTPHDPRQRETVQTEPS